MSIFNRNKHVHVWTIKEREIIDSPYLEALKRGADIQGSGKVALDLFKTTVIVHYECGCGSEKVEKL